MLAHEQLLEKRTKGKIDLYFLGNSITRRWGATDYPEFLANWKSNFFGWNAADFGWGADRIEHILWRIENGELDGVNPKVIVLLAGTNNVGTTVGDDAKVADITRGLKALIDLCRAKAPKATIILTGIFPRNDNIAVVPEINRINANLARFANGSSIRYININEKLANADGVLFDGMMVDKLHPTVKGYQLWADALKPLLTELLGPPAATDQAPPPTGDPSAKPPTSATAQASALRVPPLFANGMVLQRNKPIVVWGWAKPNAAITVALDAQQTSTTAAPGGEWSVSLPARAAGTSHTLSIASGTERLTFTNVAIGDVWVASGQSNMEFMLQQSLDAKSAIASANDPLLRHFKIPTSWSNEPAAELAGGAWSAADPAHAGAFSAVGYYFAKALREREKIPIGIINTTWGGSNIETWISRPAQGISDSAWSAELQANARRAEQTRATLRERVGTLPTAPRAALMSSWSSASFDDSAWRTMPVPAYWEPNGYDGMDGVAWYRTSFELSAADAAAGVTLQISAIDDDDVAWVNDTEIGRTVGYNVERSYRIAPAALRSGRNVLAIRVSDGGGGGGINGNIALRLANGSSTSLAGSWKFSVEQLSFAEDGQVINKVPSVLYNRMVHPILRFPVKGFIWYQGESNANNVAQAAAYRDQFGLLINSWRQQWSPSADTLPFLWVQLPNYGKPWSTPQPSSGWATQRESMEAALTLPKTGRAIAIDVGEAGDIHPRNKRDVGQRLALVAERVAYGRVVHDAGPTLRRSTVRGDTVDLEFVVTGGPLVKRADADSTSSIAIAGADRQFVWAKSRVRGSHLLVWSDKVRSPIAVRYAWSDSPNRASLFDRTGLPAAPFRTDRW